MMTKFHLIRLEDMTGISGTGIVAEGIIFSNGRCVIHWLTEHSSIAIYDNEKEMMAIHGHDGKTILSRYE